MRAYASGNWSSSPHQKVPLPTLSRLFSGILFFFYLFGIWAPIILPLSQKHVFVFSGVTEQPSCSFASRQAGRTRFGPTSKKMLQPLLPLLWAKDCTTTTTTSASCSAHQVHLQATTLCALQIINRVRTRSRLFPTRFQASRRSSLKGCPSRLYLMLRLLLHQSWQATWSWVPQVPPSQLHPPRGCSLD